MRKSLAQSDRKRRENDRLVYRDSDTGTFLSGMTTSVSADSQTVVPQSPKEEPSTSKIERAVIGYIRAIRALGRTEVNTAEIAEALNLRVDEVNSVLNELKKRGVRLL